MGAGKGSSLVQAAQSSRVTPAVHDLEHTCTLPPSQKSFFHRPIPCELISSTYLKRSQYLKVGVLQYSPSPPKALATVAPPHTPAKQSKPFSHVHACMKAQHT